MVSFFPSSDLYYVSLFDDIYRLFTGWVNIPIAFTLIMVLPKAEYIGLNYYRTTEHRNKRLYTVN